MSDPYSDGASTCIWNLNQLFRYGSVWKMRNDHGLSKYKILIESFSWKVEYVHAYKFCRIKGNCLLENGHGLNR